MDEAGLLDEIQSNIESLDGWWFDRPVTVYTHRIDDSALLIRVESADRVIRLQCELIEPSHADAFDDAWETT